nr:GSCFA domain-containing protein [Allomuricauda sp.]
MKLQTQVPLHPSNKPIDYNGNLVLLGSCFVENIGNKLSYYKFPSLINPFGILFHPLAIENLVSRAINNKFYSEEEVFEQDGRWLCFDAHSDLAGTNADDLLKNLNLGLRQTKQGLEKASHVFITLGTAWVYQKKSTQKIVANCHKVPQKEFKKELMGIEQIEESLSACVRLIHSINPNAGIVFSISPVRHLKDGFVENQRSKSHLISAVHTMLSQSTLKNGHYFPSYEIVMDELRDYRFYGKDLVHPNELAVDYIWERFRKVWISSESYPVMEEVETVQKGLNHRAFNPETEAHQKFKTSLASKITYLKERYPFMKFDL